MYDVRSYLWLIPILPLAAAVLTAFLGPRLLRQYSHWPCVLAGIGSCILSVLVFLAVRGAVAHASEGHGEPLEVETYYSWIQVEAPSKAGGPVDVGMTLRADALTAMMLVTVTFIGSLIAIFAIGYMHGDPGYARFFAAVALFIASMTGLVLASNFIVLYACWEGVGVCSYLLIGFWFTKPSAADAARKAFLVTRIGDVGMFLGILLLWVISGYSLDYQTIFKQVNPDNVHPAVITTACLLLFCGAIGKSAQFPLHVWLPDAMEGPTPVSALIHAATMVTAGVYLVARCTPLFVHAPAAQLLVCVLGGITALMAALIALTQTDLKRVLAYSTLSQLGYMFMALGAATAVPGGSNALVTFAVIAGVFHLFTHAFFKALLFLSAGSVMHAMGNVIDMRRFSGLRRLLPTTHWTFLVGCLALSGFPLFAGFWSKDEILGALRGATEEGHPYTGAYLVLLLVALLTAALTAFYTFRAYFMTFWGEERIPEEAGHHAHESPPVMTVPLMILAVFAALVGLAVGPTHLFSGFVEHTPWFPRVAPGEEPGMDWAMMSAGTVLALGGIAAAWLMYVRQPDLPGKLARSAQALYQLSLNKFHWDDLYETFIVKPLTALAALCRVFDLYVIDSLVNLIGRIPGAFGYLFRPVQNGLVQFYALAMALSLAVFLLALIYHL
jgi:NADH-quinone oxidoreductase subunit L